MTKRSPRFFIRYCTSIEVQALVTADLEGWVDNARMGQITSKHPTDITRVLQELVGRKMLIQEGQRRWTRYSLSSKSDSLHKEGIDSLHRRIHLVEISEPSSSEWIELKKTAKPIKQTRRLDNKELESMLLKLCHGRWLTRRELAELVGRNAESLRSRFLTLMVEHGLLRLRYPEKPNRVDQAYTSNDGFSDHSRK